MIREGGGGLGLLVGYPGAPPPLYEILHHLCLGINLHQGYHSMLTNSVVISCTNSSVIIIK